MLERRSGKSGRAESSPGQEEQQAETAAQTVFVLHIGIPERQRKLRVDADEP